MLTPLEREDTAENRAPRNRVKATWKKKKNLFLLMLEIVWNERWCLFQLSVISFHSDRSTLPSREQRRGLSTYPKRIFMALLERHFNRSLIGLCQWFLKSSDEFSCEKRKCSRLGQGQAAALHWPGSIKILMKEVESAVSPRGSERKSSAIWIIITLHWNCVF